MCQSFRYPCRNIWLGCKVAYCQSPGPLGRQAHELLCNFRPRNCVIDLTQRCLWTGVFGPEYLTHMKEEHLNSINESNECHIEVIFFLFYFTNIIFFNKCACNQFPLKENRDPEVLAYPSKTWIMHCYRSLFRFNVFHDEPNSMLYASVHNLIYEDARFT